MAMNADSTVFHVVRPRSWEGGVTHHLHLQGLKRRALCELHRVTTYRTALLKFCRILYYKTCFCTMGDTVKSYYKFNG
jgi:hypothetical protein